MSGLCRKEEQLTNEAGNVEDKITQVHINSDADFLFCFNNHVDIYQSNKHI